MNKSGIDPAKLARTLRRMDRVKEAIEIAATEELQNSSQDIVALARSLAPVGESGELRDSITWEWDGETRTVIGTNLWYAPFLEFGTRERHAQPFLFPAYKYHEPIFRQTLGHRVSAELRKVRTVL